MKLRAIESEMRMKMLWNALGRDTSEELSVLQRSDVAVFCRKFLRDSLRPLPVPPGRTPVHRL